MNRDTQKKRTHSGNRKLGHRSDQRPSHRSGQGSGQSAGRGPGRRSGHTPNRSSSPPKHADIILFNKPFNTLCQFTDADGRDNLSHYIQRSGFYAAGRLDRDSEGLLVLTNDGQLQHTISHPDHKLPKTYLAQVEGEVTDEAITALSQGVVLKDGKTRPAQAKRVSEPDWLWPRHPPIRERQSIPTSWVSLTLTEGRNRQVRRMTAATGFPTLRLIRIRIGQWELGTLPSGEWLISHQNGE